MYEDVSPEDNCCTSESTRVSICEEAGRLDITHNVFNNLHLLSVLLLTVSVATVNLHGITMGNCMRTQSGLTIILQGSAALQSFS